MPKLTESFERWAVWVDRSKTGERSGFAQREWRVGPRPDLYEEEWKAKQDVSLLRQMCILGYGYKVVRVLVTLKEV